MTTRVEKVEVPYAVPCVKADDVPPMPSAPSLQADADVEQLAAWARVYVVQLQQYASQLRAILTGCAEAK